MKIFPVIGGLIVSAALGACSASTTISAGTASHVGSTYSATSAGTLTAIATTKTLLNGQPIWSDGPVQTEIGGYESKNVLAIGGYNKGTLIKGVTGTYTSTPLTGTATYNGRYVIASHTSLYNNALSLNVDFGALTFADVTPGVNVSGHISGTQFSGTFTKGSDSAPLQGGFFGSHEMVGAFGNSAIAGVIYGLK